MPILKKIKNIGGVEVLDLRKAAAGVRPLSDAMALARRGMAIPGLQAVGTSATDFPGGLWTVPLFERFPHLIDVLAAGVNADLVTMMVDLTGFSTASAGKTPPQIGALLQPFYEITVNQIESNGGVVEKFIGDAVIGVFGHPFRQGTARETATGSNDLQAAVRAGMHSVKRIRERYASLSNMIITAKAAVVRGSLFAGWVGADSYSDLTVIGEPMTTLFRLEEHAPNNGLVMTAGDCVDGQLTWQNLQCSSQDWHSFSDAKEVPLRGPGKVRVREIRMK